MGWSIFIEESGVHQRSLPYGVLVGLAVRDDVIWQLVRKLNDAEVHFFGARLEKFSSFFTVDTMLSHEVMSIAGATFDLSPSERASLTKEFLRSSDIRFSAEHFAAFAQSQRAFCGFVLGLLLDFGTKAFAVFTPSKESNLTYQGQLRKDYSYLFARIFSFLEGQDVLSIGKLILDPRRHRDDFVSISSITDYFEKTTNGRLRSKLLIPEPLMASSFLSTVNRSAVIMSRILSWGFRIPGMTHPRRFDLDELVKQCNELRVSLTRGAGKKEWSFISVESIRPRQESAPPIWI